MNNKLASKFNAKAYKVFNKYYSEDVYRYELKYNNEGTKETSIREGMFVPTILHGLALSEKNNGIIISLWDSNTKSKILTCRYVKETNECILCISNTTFSFRNVEEVVKVYNFYHYQTKEDLKNIVDKLCVSKDKCTYSIFLNMVDLLKF